MKKILVAVDFSEHSNHALEMAIEIALRFEASIDLLHVFDLPIPIVNPYEIAIPPGYIQEAEESAKQKLAEKKSEVEAKGVEVRSHLATAPISQAIVDAATECGSDLLVVGTHGHTGLKHALLGSVAERIVRHSPCPVLSVK